MGGLKKDVGDLTPEDSDISPVWEFDLANEEENESECVMKPVMALPVDGLMERGVGTKVRLANGAEYWAMLFNNSLNDPDRTRRDIDINLYIDGKSHPVARPGSFGADTIGPEALARRLGLALDQIFPTAYDIGNCCVGAEVAIRGTIDYRHR